MNLTDEQWAIIRHDSGHARVSAVAGSGKTTTMVERVGQLLQRGSKAEEVLVLMFNTSARENFELSMNKRLAGLGCKLPEVRTFHSLGLRLVNSFSKRGALQNYRLVTEEHILETLARQVANEVYRQQGEEQGYLSGEDVEEFLAFIDRVKATVEEPEEVFRQLVYPSKLRFFPQAFVLFEEIRKKRRIRFFSDLIYEPIMAMLSDPSLAEWVGDRVDHIIVDEYQDINETQQVMLKRVAGSRAEVMAVGDVDQCIYEWRGAKPEYITSRFGNDFPNPSYYQLSFTFRYGHQLSLAANHLIANNKKRDRKLCVSHSSTPDTDITVVEEKEKHPVVATTRKWIKEGRSLSEAVVLLRLFGASIPVELALLEAAIPYRVVGASDLFESREIAALIGYMSLVRGTIADNEPEKLHFMLHSMFSQPHLGIPREEMEILIQKVSAAPSSAAEMLLNSCRNDYAPFIKKRFQEAADTWRWLVGSESQQPAGPFLKSLVSRLSLYDFYDSFAVKAATAENRVKSCEALISFAQTNRHSINTLLQQIDAYRNTRDDLADGQERLLITSIHRAKGLEWPLVFLTGLEEGSFPFYQENDQLPELEDERRLFYVAMTRAKEHLVFSYPMDAAYKKTFSAGSGKVPGNQIRASRFLYEASLGLVKQVAASSKKLTVESGEVEIALRSDDLGIAQQYMDAVYGNVRLVSKRKNKNKSARTKKYKCTGELLKMGDLAEGLLVVHPRFGDGIIAAVQDRKQGRISVVFKEHGEMVLLAKYARLERVGS